MFRKILYLVVFASTLITSSAQFCETPIGFGRNTTGGAGGTVYTVTTLNDGGTGSLRVALESSNTYIINFAVSGTIVMNGDIYVRSNKTIDANGTYIRLRFYSLRLDNVNNIIIRNIHFDSDHVDHGGSGDAITIINGTTNVWVDHCTFEDWFDGTVDITEQSDFVTVSWCRFRAHDKVMLIGASDNSTADAGKLHVTVHHCYFDNTTQRHPRSRFGLIHVLNNYFNGVSNYAVASCADAKTHIERNRFEDVGTPSILSASSSWQGYITETGNQRINSGTITTRTPTFTPSSFYPYTAETADNTLRDFSLAYAGYNTTTNMSLTVSGNTMTANYLARSFQWYRDGILISGATSNSYTAPNCGTYSVRLYGDNGCYKELSHVITAGQPAVPSITVLGGNAYFCTGGSVTLRSTLAPGGYAYQWVRNSNDISGATSRDYIVTQQGNYRVRLTGACSTANSALVFVEDRGTPDCNGVCGGTAVPDCNGVCNGTAVPDDCGICSGGNTGHVANSDKDCNGICFGTAVLDCNGVCGGTAVLDCAGICGGTTTVDCSGVCGGTDTLDCAGGCNGVTLDCNGVCGGTDTLDCAGACGGTAIVDCNGDCNGTAFLDDCGICSGGNTGHIANSDKDCAGNCFGTTTADCHGDCGGTAVVDDCGICSGGNTGYVTNADKDCSGVCFGNAVTDCNGDCNGNAVLDSCGVCLNPTDSLFNLTCLGCDGVINSGLFSDTCGNCLLPSDPSFNICNTTHSFSFSDDKLVVSWYPNPAANEINISVSRVTNSMQLKIFNSLGQVIKQNELQMPCTPILLTDISSGIYFYELRNSKGTLKTGKLVKQ